MVAVAHDQRERAAERLAMAHAAEDLGVVLLQLLARRAAVPRLAPCEIAAHALAVDLQAGRQPGDDGGDAGAVRLAGRHEGQVHGGERTNAPPRGRAVDRAAPGCAGRV